MARDGGRACTADAMGKRVEVLLPNPRFVFSALVKCAIGAAVLLSMQSQIIHFFGKIEEVNIAIEVAFAVAMFIWAAVDAYRFLRVLILREEGFEQFSLSGRKAGFYEDSEFISIVHTERFFNPGIGANIHAEYAIEHSWAYRVENKYTERRFTLNSRFYRNFEEEIIRFNMAQKAANRPQVPLPAKVDRWTT